MLLQGDVGAGIERVVDQLTQDDLAQVLGLASGLLRQRGGVEKQLPILPFEQKRPVTLSLPALALRRWCAGSASGCHSSRS